MCKIFQRIKDALQSPPGKFLLALAGGLAVGGLAYKAGKRNASTRITEGVRRTDVDATAGEINRIQRDNAESIAESFKVIDGILHDIRYPDDNNGSVCNVTEGGGEY